MLLRFPSPLWVQGSLIRRYKRFLADVMLGSGANPGAMLGLAAPGAKV